MEWMIAAAACVGTALQFTLALLDLRETRSPALRWSVAEDDLVAEQRPWRRRQTKRELRSWRPADINADIRRINTALVSWMFLLGASVAALAREGLPW